MKLWLSRYLSLLTLIPVVVLLLFMLTEISRDYHALTQANDTIADARLVTITSQLVHELQKERGMSAGFIGSNGAKFASTINNQRTLTDRNLQTLKGFMQENSYHQETTQTIQKLMGNLGQLSAIRKRVDDLTISLADALSYYTGNNLLILDLNGHLAAELEETSSAERFLTLYNIAYAKEQAGIERAVLSNVFASDTFTPALFIRFIELVTKQDTYIKSTYSVATADYAKVVDQFVQSKESREIMRYRDIAKNSQKDFGVDPQTWFDAATARINKLKATEQSLLDEITVYAQDKVSSRRFVIIFVSIVLILMIAVAYAVFATIRLRARQSQEINRLMQKVDTEKDLTDSAQIISEDELGKIATLMNQTFLNIRNDLKSFQDNAHEIGSATLQAASATDQSKANLMQLQLDITGIVSATEEMSVSIKSVMDNMQTASGGADNAAKETENGEKAVKVSLAGITKTADEVALVGQTITELNTRVNDILGMVDVIKSVAEQTNLLALNAAIEAARAGEQGRGFAVVADEVRSLAQRTQESTEEISNVVDVLQNSSQTAFSSIESGNQQAKEAVTNAQQIYSVLNKIVENVNAVNDVTSLVATSTKEQSSVIDSINDNAANIDDQARENVVGAEQLAAASRQLSEIARDMEKRVEAYKV